MLDLQNASSKPPIHHNTYASQASPVELDDLRLRVLLSQSNDLSKRNSSIAYTSRWIALKMCSMASPSFLNTWKVAPKIFAGLFIYLLNRFLNNVLRRDSKT